MNKAAKKLGIFGGSFDPIHLGHLAMAQAALNNCALDEIVFVPCRRSAYQHKQLHATTEQRLAMLKLATAAHTHFSIDCCELDRPTPSYALNTLQYFKDRYPDATLCFLLGEDALAMLPSWHQWALLFSLAHLIVLPRQQNTKLTALSQEPLKSVLKQRLSYDIADLSQQRAGCVLYLKTTLQPISSTYVREQLKCNPSLPNALPAVVQDYIMQHQLYGVKPN